MQTEELIGQLAAAPGQTPVKVYIWEKRPVGFPGCRVFEGEGCKLLFGEWENIRPVLREHQEDIADVFVECTCRESRVPLLDFKDLDARIEPGALIRRGAQIGRGAVILMGAVINIGAVVGAGTMVDMNAVLGGRATVGKNCHIGAGAVLAGVLEPPSAQPVVIEDDVLIGANAVVLEGVRVGRGAVVAAGAVVTEDVPPEAVVAGSPARFIKFKDAKTAAKTAITPALRDQSSR